MIHLISSASSLTGRRCAFPLSVRFSLVRSTVSSSGSLEGCHALPRSCLLACLAGATDGIGKAYAEELASRGLNIILISHEEEKLQAVAKHIADTYRVETVVMVADFSRGREVYAPIREALRDRDIGILVNDMGAFYPYPQYFTQIPEDTLWDIVNVNIAAASLMVHIVLPGMVERKKGAIVTVSSGACCKPTPQLAAISASKVRLFFPWDGQGVVSSHLLMLVVFPKMGLGKSFAPGFSFKVLLGSESCPPPPLSVPPGLSGPLQPSPAVRVCL